MKKIMRLLNGHTWTGGGPALKSALPDFGSPNVVVGVTFFKYHWGWVEFDKTFAKLVVVGVTFF